MIAISVSLVALVFFLAQDRGADDGNCLHDFFYSSFLIRLHFFVRSSQGDFFANSISSSSLHEDLRHQHLPSDLTASDKNKHRIMTRVKNCTAGACVAFSLCDAVLYDDEGRRREGVILSSLYSAECPALLSQYLKLFIRNSFLLRCYTPPISTAVAHKSTPMSTTSACISCIRIHWVQ